MIKQSNLVSSNSSSHLKLKLENIKMAAPKKVVHEKENEGVAALK